uniref:Uncharacterized protein n=1 Tax=Tetranychus urticae TaxID=32264 RepID=A0A158P4T2_TETUR
MEISLLCKIVEVFRFVVEFALRVVEEEVDVAELIFTLKSFVCKLTALVSQGADEDKLLRA